MSTTMRIAEIKAFFYHFIALAVIYEEARITSDKVA